MKNVEAAILEITGVDHVIRNKKIEQLLASTDIIDVHPYSSGIVIMCNRKGDPAKMLRWCDVILVKKMSAAWAEKNGASFSVGME